MRTRTLLLLAVACGLAILLAGGIRLLTISSDDDPADLKIGATGAAGDARVTVLSATESDERLVVTVRFSGVDDPDGINGFELLAGSVIDPASATAPGQCRTLSLQPTTCDLVFDVADVVGTARVLRFHRGEQQVRWALA
jgi:hypothetical protein